MQAAQTVHHQSTSVSSPSDCACDSCAGSPTKMSSRRFIPSSPEQQPIVKGNNRYGAKGTIRCLACQRRKGKCEFPPEKPDLPCEHCKRRGLRCGEKLPTERKRQLTASSTTSADDQISPHLSPYNQLRTFDASGWGTPIVPPAHSHSAALHQGPQALSSGSYSAVSPVSPPSVSGGQYYRDQQSGYPYGGRPVAPAVHHPLQDPRAPPSTHFVPRPYQVGSHHPNLDPPPQPSSQSTHPPPPHPNAYPPPAERQDHFEPRPLFPSPADLVRFIEIQIPKISLQEEFAVARCLASDHSLVSNKFISDVQISRKNQEFSRGDSWFNVQWWEMSRQGRHLKSISLRFEPGRQACTSYPADGDQGAPAVQQQPQQQHGKHVQREYGHSVTQGLPSPPTTEETMDIDPPKQAQVQVQQQSPHQPLNWSGLVGDLFDKAAGLVDDKKVQVKPELKMEESLKITHPIGLWSEFKHEKSSSVEASMSTALWPAKLWQTISQIIFGQDVANSKKLYTIDIPHTTIGVIVEQFKTLGDLVMPSTHEPTPPPEQFIYHSTKKKKISLNTLAKVLIQLQSLKARRPKTADESIQFVEELVDDESHEPTVSPKKRRFEEIDQEDCDQRHTTKGVKTETSDHSPSTPSTNGRKVRVESPMPVDEETSKAASILNGVSQSHQSLPPQAPRFSAVNDDKWRKYRSEYHSSHHSLFHDNYARQQQTSYQ